MSSNNVNPEFFIIILPFSHDNANPHIQSRCPLTISILDPLRLQVRQQVRSGDLKEAIYMPAFF
jgi:hypothetical protein